MQRSVSRVLDTYRNVRNLKPNGQFKQNKHFFTTTFLNSDTAERVHFLGHCKSILHTVSLTAYPLFAILSLISKLKSLFNSDQNFSPNLFSLVHSKKISSLYF